MKDTRTFKRFMTDRQLKLMVAMYHLTPSGRHEYINEAGDPVRIRTANIDSHEKGYRLGRFDLASGVHNKLVLAGGYYLFILYRINRFGSDIIIKHGLRPASDFKVSKSKVAKIHVRDVFDEVKG